MATLELSNGFITSGPDNGYTRRIVTGWANGLSNSGLMAASGIGDTGQLFILKGAVPTNFTGLTSWGVRSSDVLLQFKLTLAEIIVNYPGNNTATFSTIYKNATASGTASWFWLMTAFDDGTSNRTIYQQMIGTIGTQGSGADMEISNTTVTSGSPYRVISSTITLPTSWTY